MTHPSPLARLRPSALAVALALCGAPMALQAATISLSASYSLNGGAVQNGLTDPAAQFSGDQPPYPTSNGSDFYLSKQEGLSNVFFHTYGFLSDPTYFGARSSGEGQWSTATAATYSTQFTNGGLAALPLSLSFYVDSGDLGLFGTGTGQAELILRVRVNGIDVARDQTTITSNGSGFKCTENDLGTALAAYTSCGGNDNANQAFGSGGLYVVDLGLLEAGRSITVDYDIIATTSGSFSSGAVNCNYQGYGGYEGYGGYGGYGELTLQTEGPFGCPTFNGIARSGDPFNLPLTDAAPGTPFDPRFNVPTPGSLALAGLAAVIAAATRRRRLRHRR